MYNLVVIMGRITGDLEIKTTPAGVSVLSFSVAVERPYKTGGEKQTDFINCVAWRNTAEFISRFFHKGCMILVDGELQTRSYQDKNGVTRYVTEVSVHNAAFTGEKREQGQEQAAPQNAPQTPAQPQNQQPNSNTYSADDFADTQNGEGYPF